MQHSKCSRLGNDNDIENNKDVRLTKPREATYGILIPPDGHGLGLVMYPFGCAIVHMLESESE